MVEVVSSPRAFDLAADRLAAMLDSIQGDRVRLAIPGGSAAAVAPAAVERLVRAGFDPARLALTWVDERCVPSTSSESNRGAVRFDRALGHELALYQDGETPADAVARVSADLGEAFGGRIDVALLGLGEDGHVASLFPGRPAPRGAVAHVPDSPKPPSDRITLTAATLATARHTLVYALGEGKREALARLVAGDPALPATGLPGLVVVTDLDLGENS